MKPGTRHESEKPDLKKEVYDVWLDIKWFEVWFLEEGLEESFKSCSEVIVKFVWS